MNTPTVRPVTRNGRTHYVEEPAALPPLTPDEIIMRGVGAATAVVVTGALVWSTVSVGAMLAQLAPAWAAYMIAGVFDLAWIVAMAMEFVLRFEPGRQKVPKTIGWLALLASMGAIFTHGALLDKPWIGAFGALVSALAKGLWWLLMFVTTRRLDRDTQAWLTLELGEIHARRAEQNALAKVRREREKYALGLAADPPVTAEQPEPPTAPVALPKPVKQSPPMEAAGPVGEEIEDIDGLLGQHHAPVVYFLRNGTRVKIGTSRNLRPRIARLALRPDNVMRVEHGGQDYEQSLHARFDEYRVGNTEWFELRGELAAYLGEPDAQPLELTAQFVEPTAHLAEPAHAGGGLSTVSMQASTSEPAAPAAAPEAQGFGFSAHLTAQSAQRAKALARVAELLAEDRGITSEQVKEELGVSPATAKRYLREVRQAL